MALIDTGKNCVLFKYNGTPTPANVVNIEEFVNVAPDIKKQEYKEMDGQLGNTKSYIDDQHTTATFVVKAKLRGNDKTGAAPETTPAIHELLLSAGLSADAGPESVTYTINHGTLSPAQAVVYVDGRKRTVTGVVSDLRIAGEIGFCATVEFTCNGYTGIAFVSEANPTVVLDSEALMVVNKISAVTVDGSTFNLKSFDFALGNDIVDVYAIGLGQYERTNLDPKITLTGYEDSTSTAWADLAAQGLKAVVITLGTGVGKTVELRIDSALPTTNSESDDGGKLGITREFRCIKDTTTGEHFELTWK